MKTSLFLTLLALVSLTACNAGSRTLTPSSGASSSPTTQPSAQAASVPTTGTNIPFETVVQVGVSGVEKAQNLAITSETALKTLWEEHSSNSSQEESLPEVDFSKETLLAVFMGQKSTGGYKITIKRVVLSGDTLVVEYQNQEPTGDVFITVITSPMHLVKIQKAPSSFKTVSFKEVD